MKRMNSTEEDKDSDEESEEEEEEEEGELSFYLQKRKPTLTKRLIVS